MLSIVPVRGDLPLLFVEVQRIPSGKSRSRWVTSALEQLKVECMQDGGEIPCLRRLYTAANEQSLNHEHTCSAASHPPFEPWASFQIIKLTPLAI